MKKIKWIAFVIGIIFILLGVHLTFRYFVNEIYISNYDSEKYDNKILSFLKIINVPESYIVYYNEGNYFYQVEKYEEAIISYDKALKTTPKDRVCDVRHNLALSRLQVLDYENNNSLKYELEEIQELLLEDDCAKEMGNGNHDLSQELYDKIDELLKEQKQDDGKGGDNDDDNKKSDDNNVSDQKEQEIESQLREQQKSSNAERQKMNRYNYDYYKGKSW